MYMMVKYMEDPHSGAARVARFVGCRGKGKQFTWLAYAPYIVTGHILEANCIISLAWCTCIKHIRGKYVPYTWGKYIWSIEYWHIV